MFLFIDYPRKKRWIYNVQSTTKFSNVWHFLEQRNSDFTSKNTYIDFICHKCYFINVISVVSGGDLWCISFNKNIKFISNYFVWLHFDRFMEEQPKNT